jgi:hypothetical protein
MKYILCLVIILWGCGSDESEKSHGASTATTTTQKGTQINLTILLDLSDRIDPQKNPDNPEHFERDSALISYLSDYFIRQMEAKGTFMARGKMRVIFHPNPQNQDINLAATKLSVDLSKMDPKGKKNIHETLKRTVAENISNIYAETIRQGVWTGSDIWRFFKNDVKDMAVDPDSSYRNLLVVFTDGYLYHDSSKDKDGNRYAYILPGLFDKYKLRSDKNWGEKMDKLDFGLICKRSDLEQLEVLVLEVTPSSRYKNDEDIIRKIMDKWFAEMKVKKWKIINSDLPQFTSKKADAFLQELTLME